MLILASSAKIAVETRPTPKGEVKAVAVARISERIASFMIKVCGCEMSDQCRFLLGCCCGAMPELR